MTNSSSKFAPPWFDAETGTYYGPETEATYAKHIADYRNWALRKQGPERPEAKLMHRFVFAMHAELPESELVTYRLIYVHRMSLNDAAEEQGLSRSSIRSYVKRLKVRADEWQCSLDNNPDNTAS